MPKVGSDGITHCTSEKFAYIKRKLREKIKKEGVKREKEKGKESKILANQFNNFNINALQ